MLKNLNQYEDNNSENIQETSNEEENEILPLVNLNISLNNGQKTCLSIYENDNVEQKVQDFCLKNRISPNDQKLLMQRVKSELETNFNTSKTDTIQYDNRSSNKIIDVPKDKQQMYPRFMDFIPKEKNKLEHILNESETLSFPDSKRQSSNLDIKDSKSDSNSKINSEVDNEFNFKQQNLSEETSKTSTINNNIKKNLNENKNDTNNENPYIVNNNILLDSRKNNNFNSINKNFPLNEKELPIGQIVSATNNQYNNNLSIIQKGQINNFNNIYDKKNNQILFINNSGEKINRLNNTFQNIGNQNNNPLKLNNTYLNVENIDYNVNKIQQNINPFNDSINQRIEIVDTANNNLIPSSISLNPNIINNENNNKYNII